MVLNSKTTVQPAQALVLVLVVVLMGTEPWCCFYISVLAGSIGPLAEPPEVLAPVCPSPQTPSSPPLEIQSTNLRN